MPSPLFLLWLALLALVSFCLHPQLSTLFMFGAVCVFLRWRVIHIVLFIGFVWASLVSKGALYESQPLEIDSKHHWTVTQQKKFSSEIENEWSCRAIVNRSLPKATAFEAALEYKEQKTIESAGFPADEIRHRLRWPCGSRRLPGSVQTSLPDPSSSKKEAWFKALFLGDRSGLNRGLLEQAQYLGVAHFLVFSGFHLALIFFAVQRALALLGRRMPILGFAWMSMLVEVFVLLAFLQLQPHSIALKRCAGVILGLSFIERIWPAYRRYRASDRLCFVGIGFLFFDPFLVFHLGYLLSFGITWILLFFNEKNEASVNKLLSGFAAVLASQLILISFYQETSIWSWFTNLIFAPLFIALVLPSFLLSDGIASQVLGLLEKILNGIYLFALDFQWSTQVQSVGLASIFFILAISTARLSRRLLLFLLCGICLFSKVSIPSTTGQSKQTLQLRVFDVGQGDAFLISYRGKNIMIDGGRSSRLHSKLKKAGVHEIHLWLLTHFDTDHIGYFVERSPRFSINEVWIPRWDSSNKTDLVQSGLASRTRLRRLQWEGPQEWKHGRVHLVCESFQSGRFEVKNNDSMHCELRFDGRLVLVLSGDLAGSGERRHLRRKERPKQRADVLIAGHHGSKTSSMETWVAHYQPKTVVFSLGRSNSYGFPHPYVLDRFKRWDATILRTDALGDMTFLWKQKSVD